MKFGILAALTALFVLGFSGCYTQLQSDRDEDGYQSGPRSYADEPSAQVQPDQSDTTQYADSDATDDGAVINNYYDNPEYYPGYSYPGYYAGYWDPWWGWGGYYGVGLYYGDPFFSPWGYRYHPGYAYYGGGLSNGPVRNFGSTRGRSAGLSLSERGRAMGSSAASTRAAGTASPNGRSMTVPSSSASRIATAARTRSVAAAPRRVAARRAVRYAPRAAMRGRVAPRGYAPSRTSAAPRSGGGRSGGYSGAGRSGGGGGGGRSSGGGGRSGGGGGGHRGR